MALKTVDAINTRKEIIRILPNQSFIGQYIRQYMYEVGGRKLQVNPDFILQIVEKFAKDVNGDDVHKIRMSNNTEILVNEAGRLQIVNPS